MRGNSDRPALIAGGGIGGLATAIALAQVGWPSIVLERRSQWSEAGAGIQLSSNGIAVLDRLGVAPLLAPFAGVPQEIVVREAASAHILQRLPLGDWIRSRHGFPYWLAHRRDLQAALVERATHEPLIRIEQGFEVAATRDEGDRVTVASSLGTRREGALLVGADGVLSRIRAAHLGTPDPRFAGRTAARTVVAADQLPRGAETEPVIDARRTGVWLAPGAHIVHYPVRAGREIAVVVVQSEAWAETGWSAPVHTGDIEAVLARIAPAFLAGLGRGHDWRRWALFRTEPLARWSKGRVTVLGDAAHPTLPFLAQGGVLALEDAVTLADCLARGTDVPAALLAYERARADRAKAVVAAARRNDTVFHLSGPAALARNAAMRVIPGERVVTGYDWVYGWKPPQLRAAGER